MPLAETHNEGSVMVAGELVPLRRQQTVSLTDNLNTLAQVANAEHDAAQAAMGSVVEHCIRAGEALILAKERLGREGKKVPWQRWVADNYSGHFTNAYMCVRFARNAKAILDSGVTTKRDALTLVKTVEAEARASERERAPEAKRLIKEGYSQRQAAEIMGVHRRTVERLASPDADKRAKDRNKAARAALRKAEQDAETRAAVKMLGKGRTKTLADVYALVRQAVQAAEAVGTDALEVQEKLYEVEDLIGALLRGHK